MSRLFDKAQVDFKVAMNCFGESANDEGFLSNTCYNLQQATEKLLKYVLEVQGIAYPKTHDIEVLIDKCSKAGFVVSDRLMTIAPTLTIWEATSRYNDNFVTSARAVEIACEEFKLLSTRILELQNSATQEFD